MIKYDKYDKVW